MDINRILDKIMDFYSWIYDTTGLPKWQLLILALSVLFVLFVILSYQKKSAFRKFNKQRIKQRRSDIIGSQLTGSYGVKKEQLNSSAPQNDEEQQLWGQTTKDWRKLREKLRHLQHELSKHEKTEKQLQEEIAALKITNDKLESEIRKRTQIEDKFQQEINEFTTSAFTENQDKQPILGNVQPQASQIPDSSIEISKEDIDPSNENTNGLPLDIKELKDIAALVKRLQARSQQRQGEQ